MKTIVATLALAFAAFASSAQTTPAQPAQAEQKKPLTAQQQKMAKCNKEAGDRKGDDRKAFMKECLSKKD